MAPHICRWDRRPEHEMPPRRTSRRRPLPRPILCPFSEPRESRPEQRTDCEDLPDSDNVQDVGWIADGADILYDIGKVRKVHESPHQNIQEENGCARNVDDSFVHSRTFFMYSWIWIQSVLRKQWLPGYTALKPNPWGSEIVHNFVTIGPASTVTGPHRPNRPSLRR